MDGQPVEWYTDVFDLVFPNLDRSKASTLWQDQLTKSKSREEAKEESKDKD
jgi:Lon-like ATP-dependent protease